MILPITPTSYAEIYRRHAVLWEQVAIHNGVPQVKRTKVTGTDFETLRKELAHESHIYPRSIV